MILITGFTGNTGEFVLSKLLEKYKPENIIGLTRSTNYKNIYRINILEGSLDDPELVANIFKNNNISNIIHIANIRFSPLIMELANQYHIKRVVLVHTTGVYSVYREYSKLYKDIEKRILQNSYPNTTYIIVRPTMIYGNDRDHNMHKLIMFLDKYPVFPLFGEGKALMQPIHVEDLADGIIKAFEKKEVTNEDFDFSGGSIVSYKEVLNLIRDELGKRIFFLHIPLKIAITSAKVYNRFFKKAIISVEQVERLQENKSYSNEKAKRLLGFNPRSFEAGIIQEVRLLRSKEMIK